MNKKMTRLFSLAVAVLMVLSLAVISVSAASVSHVATISLDDTSGKAGDTVNVSVTLDSPLNTYAMGYRLKFDPNVFSINTEIDPDYATAKCISTDWQDTYGALAVKPTKTWNTLTMNADAVAGTISIAGSRSSGISVNTANIAIGGFILTVKAGATAGDSTITLIDATTADFGQSTGAAMTFTPVTYTVEAAAPVTHKVTYDANGGTGIAPTQADVAEGAKFTAAANTFTYTGKNFVKWNTAADGTGTDYAADAEVAMGTSDIVLYAIWADKAYSILPSISVDGGAVGEVGGTVYINNTEVTGTVAISTGDTAKIAIEPKFGYEIKTATLKGVSLDFDTLGDSRSDVAISGEEDALVVVFAKRTTSEKPQVAKKVFKQTDFKDDKGINHKADVTFAQKPKSGSVSEYGVYLEKGSVAVSFGDVTDGYFAATADSATTDGQYGIRFVELPDGTYTATPYAKVGANIVKGNAVTFIVATN